jgi:mannose-1-phosphate guanylyltransferase
MNPTGRPKRRDCLESIDVLVLAGGLGTRVAAVLGDKPKLLASVGARPYIAHLIDWLDSFGARRIVLGLGHLAGPVLAYLETNPQPGLEIEPVIEPFPLGTAGAIRFARDRLKSDPVMVINGDSLVDADLCHLIDRHRNAGKLGTLLCTAVEDTSRYGRVVIDSQQHISGFVEKDANSHTSGTISAGVYLLSARLLDDIADHSYTSLERDVFAHQPPGALTALVGRYRFIDIGTPETLKHVDEYFDHDFLNNIKINKYPE